MYRDCLRHFWRGDRGRVPELASRLSGSSDIYEWSGRSAYASINFITAHDGFTLHDLVSYEQKHNEANGENNRDGHDDNVSRNWGVEGETNDEDVLDLRYRVMRSMIAALAFSQGVPMFSHGDEVSRTQRGNNNAYCQDNELTWVDWSLDKRREDLLAYTSKVFALRRDNAVLRRRHFFRGALPDSEAGRDVMWVRPDGQEMQHDDWDNPENRVLGMLIHGEATDETDERGEPVQGDTLLILLNGGSGGLRFILPAVEGGMWVELLDSADARRHPIDQGWVHVDGRSLVLLRHGRERRWEATVSESEAHSP
jgi:glycogen operon protein